MNGMDESSLMHIANHNYIDRRDFKVNIDNRKQLLNKFKIQNKHHNNNNNNNRISSLNNLTNN